MKVFNACHLLNWFMKMQKATGIALILACTLLQACSGGGSGSDTGTNDTSTSVILGWAQPTQTTTGDAVVVANNKIYIGTASGTYSTTLAIVSPGDGSVTAEIDPDLFNFARGTTYYIVVTAIDGEGNESTVSNEAFVSIP